MANTYTKGGSDDTWIFPGNLSVTGTFAAAGAESYTLDATEEAIDIDAGTTDHTGAQLIDVNLDVNSASVKVINMDIDVGTALSTGEKVYGAYIDIDGAAGDHSASEFAAVYATSANTSGSSNNSGVELAGTFDTGIKLGAVTTADGILVSGTGVDGIHISGAQSANALHISGNQAVAMLVDVDDDLATGISYSVDTGKTVTTGIEMTGVGTVTTGFNFAPEIATPGISIGITGKTYTTGIFGSVTGSTVTTGLSFVGTSTTAIDMSGAITTGLNIAGSAMTTGVSVGLTGKTYTTGVAVGVSGGTLTTGLVTAGTVTTGISLGATTTNHIVFAAVGTGTDGNLIKGGAVGAGALSCGTTADTSFVKLYTRSTATTGDARGIYNRLYLGGAGGSGEAARHYTTIDAGKAVATAHGAHISLDFADATATLTGLGVAMRATLHVPNGVTNTGTRAAIQAELYSDGASSDISGALCSAIRVVADGAGKANLDTNAYFLDLSAMTAGATGFIDTDITTGTHHSGLRVRMPDGTTKYIAIISA